MIPEAWFGKKLACVVIGLFCLALLAQTTLYAADNKIVLPKYPQLKIGFTTANFLKVYPTNVANIKKLLDFAADQGFAFIEIRDSEAKLSLSDCKELAAYAIGKDVEIIYAMDIGLLDSNYWEIFPRGLANAGVFNGPKFVRTGANGAEMMADAKKNYWTAAEFAKLVANANKASKMAKEQHMKFLVENAREGLKGDGTTSFGTTELFGPKGVSKDIGLQLDAANFFCTSRVPATPDVAKAFVEAHAGRIGYTHLKTSKNHVPQQVLDGNELSFDTYFKLLQKHRKYYVTVELDRAGTADEAFANHVKSVAYLKKNF